ncbi:hypothetical protein [Halonotius sp. GCM10025705]|uniref:hypothetical protein n=1 Tax=Halonotius sp. GCM10025705 TaxID=3252678 RepID=UPI003608FB93
MTPTRRQFGATTVGVTVGMAGCLTGEPGTGFGGDDGTDDSDTDDDSDNELSATTQQLVDNLDERGLTVQSTTTTDEAIQLTVQTTGDTDSDIQIAASAFATLLNSEPAVDRDLRVRVEDRGLDQGRFRIEAAWARQFLSDDLSDNEYLAVIADTWRE